MMRLVLILIFVGYVFTGNCQNYMYPNNSNISDSKGIVKKQGTFYFPINMFTDTIVQGCLRDVRKIKSIPFEESIPKDSVEEYDSIYTKVDKFHLDWYSKFLYSSNEPILSNYYLGDEMFRFTWLRSFHPGIVIRLVKGSNGCKMICKKISGFRPNNITVHDKSGNAIRVINSDSKFDKDTIVQVNEKMFATFKELIVRNNFEKMPNKQYVLGLDGSEWILEMHTAKSYWVVNRWSPNDSDNSKFKELCDFLIKNGIFNKEEKY